MKTRNLFPAAMLAACLLAGCSDPNTYPFPLAETENRLAGEKLTYYHKDKAFHLSIKPAHGNAMNVTINAPEAYWMAECVILLESVDQESTRLVPKCGKSDNEYKQEKFEGIEETIAEKARLILLGEDAAAQAAS